MGLDMRREGGKGFGKDMGSMWQPEKRDIVKQNNPSPGTLHVVY